MTKADRRELDRARFERDAKDAALMDVSRMNAGLRASLIKLRDGSCPHACSGDGPYRSVRAAAAIAVGTFIPGELPKGSDRG
jgi:hypothetical protein